MTPGVTHCACPQCAQPGHALPYASYEVVVDYYRCEGCGRVWGRSKGSPDAPAVDISPEPESGEAARAEQSSRPAGHGSHT
jgi:hypothetical protein